MSRTLNYQTELTATRERRYVRYKDVSALSQ